ncbi:hypothetical protein B9Z65_6371 [Elsinoe australis]|uniref:Uncharacterized protein n=1 Tax=Elsinoe australis TaxID=40998 RepID=A0A2P8A8F8_9PEZI|nr:hypothetical protein B9Z65_6371 [Elsinoe australis]
MSYPLAQSNVYQAQLVQAYMILRSQQTSVQRRLASPSPESPLSSASSSPESRPLDFGDESPSTPARRRSSASPSASPVSRSPRSSFLRRPSIPSIPEQPESEHRIDTDEGKLADINNKIKATLTDLLNCDSVRNDERMRNWVQTRLMDAQQSLNERRRHSSSAAHRRFSNASGQGWTYGYPHGVRVDQLMTGETVRKLSI